MAEFVDSYSQNTMLKFLRLSPERSIKQVTRSLLTKLHPSVLIWKNDFREAENWTVQKNTELDWQVVASTVHYAVD